MKPHAAHRSVQRHAPVRRKAGIAVLAAVVCALTALAAGGRFAAAQEIDPLIQIKKDLGAVLENQKTILAELQALQEELNVVKIRCTSN